MKKRIHINQHQIKANRRDGTVHPCITVKTYKDNQYANNVRIEGESELQYQPDNPLSCGAVLWMQTDNPVVLLDHAGEEIGRVE